MDTGFAGRVMRSGQGCYMGNSVSSGDTRGTCENAKAGVGKN